MKSILLFAALTFPLAYTQAPLYYSNQNQYFLHGLAAAGYGCLKEDWLAKTADPTPAFSALVKAAAQSVGPEALHLVYAVLQCLFLLSLASIFRYIAGPRESPSLLLVFLAMLILVHAGASRWVSTRLLGLDYPWYLQAGVAGQYVLGGMFQPSTFGILLVLGLCLFLWDKKVLGVFCVCLGATLHSTYLLPAGLLTLGFMASSWMEGRRQDALTLGAMALVLVLPVALAVFIRFQPTSPEEFQEAQHILAHFRIPHHCLPHLWFDFTACVQVLWVLLAVFLARHTKLGILLGVPLSCGAVLTVVQVVAGSDTLALLFPWRISAVLMPVATAVNLTYMVLASPRVFDHVRVAWCAGVAIALLASAGVAIMVFGLGYQSENKELPLLDYVRANKAPGNVYLIPVGLPDHANPSRGSLSGDFQPLSAKKSSKRLIPADLMRFRLYTEAPIYIDFKAIPYKDTDVLTWRRRLERMKDFYEAFVAGKFAEVRAQLAQEGITHIVISADLELVHPDVTLEFPGPVYKLYRLRK